MRTATRRSMAAVGLLVIAAMLLTACGSSTQTPDPARISPGATASSQSDSYYPVTVTNCGRTLTFDKAPERVITGYEPAFEVMVALGLGDRILGRANFSYLPEEQNGGFPPGPFKQVYDSTREVSPTIKLPTKEKLLTLQPDFVINSDPDTFEASEGYATLSDLEANNAVGFLTGGACGAGPETDVSIATIFEDYRNLGKIFNVQDRANALIAEQQAILDDVRNRVGNLKPVRVLSTDGGTGPVAVQGAGLVTEMITAAGGVNVFADAPESYFLASVEQVADSNPEAMLVEDYAPQEKSAQTKADEVFAIIKNSLLAQEKRYLSISAVAYHPGYSTVPVVETIARFLHPEKFQ